MASRSDGACEWPNVFECEGVLGTETSALAWFGTEFTLLGAMRYDGLYQCSCLFRYFGCPRIRSVEPIHSDAMT
jgi:hypothetical protein